MRDKQLSISYISYGELSPTESAFDRREMYLTVPAGPPKPPSPPTPSGPPQPPGPNVPMMCHHSKPGARFNNDSTLPSIRRSSTTTSRKASTHKPTTRKSSYFKFSSFDNQRSSLHDDMFLTVMGTSPNSTSSSSSYGESSLSPVSESDCSQHWGRRSRQPTLLKNHRNNSLSLSRLEAARDNRICSNTSATVHCNSNSQLVLSDCGHDRRYSRRQTIIEKDIKDSGHPSSVSCSDILPNEESENGASWKSSYQACNNQRQSFTYPAFAENRQISFDTNSIRNENSVQPMFASARETSFDSDFIQQRNLDSSNIEQKSSARPVFATTRQTSCDSLASVANLPAATSPLKSEPVNDTVYVRELWPSLFCLVLAICITTILYVVITKPHLNFRVSSSENSS